LEQSFEVATRNTAIRLLANFSMSLDRKRPLQLTERTGDRQATNRHNAMSHAYTEDQLVEQPAIGLFAELGWKTVSALEEIFGASGTLGRRFDFYQKLDNWFTVGTSDFEMRPCMETKVDIYRK
jgi:hypothetical protein